VLLSLQGIDEDGNGEIVEGSHGCGFEDDDGGDDDL
jgi:hypothetical protein